MNKNYGRYLSLILIKTLGLGCLLTFFICEILTSKHTGFEEKQADFIDLLANIFWIIALTITSLTYFLNILKPIRSKPLYRLLSFFLLPVILAVTVIGYSIIQGASSIDTLLASTFIFFITLIFFYFRFLAYTKSDRYN
ncbi:hypothetical protein ACFGVR_18945 [Mucilaginibacter sp. AW1-3]